MTDQDRDQQIAESAAATGKRPDRVFLCVVDASEELHVALRFAARRAADTVGDGTLAIVVDVDDRFDDTKRRALLLRRAH